MLKGLRLSCQSACIHTSMMVSEIEDDIVGPDPTTKALYWIERTLEDDIVLSENLTNMIGIWLKEDSSKYLEFTSKIGSIRITKRFLSA